MKIAALSTASTFLTWVQSKQRWQKEDTSHVSFICRFFFGFTWNVAINLVMKTLSAVPRPHFIDTCNPDWTLMDCDKYKGWVVTICHWSHTLSCRNVEYNISHCQVSENEQKEVFDAMKSFPSGHAQVACFTAAFLIVSIIIIFYSCWVSTIKPWQPAFNPVFTASNRLDFYCWAMYSKLTTTKNLHGKTS